MLGFSIFFLQSATRKWVPWISSEKPLGSCHARIYRCAGFNFLTETKNNSSTWVSHLTMIIARHLKISIWLFLSIFINKKHPRSCLRSVPKPGPQLPFMPRIWWPTSLWFQLLQSRPPNRPAPSTAPTRWHPAAPRAWNSRMIHIELETLLGQITRNLRIPLWFHRWNPPNEWRFTALGNWEISVEDTVPIRSYPRCIPIISPWTQRTQRTQRTQLRLMVN